MKEVGFWCVAGPRDAVATEQSPLLTSQQHDNRPDPTKLVDHRWYLTNTHMIRLLEWYLLEGACVESHELAYSFCRFSKCNEATKDPKVMGACTLTDGVYVWPEGYWHYIRYHHVRPPQEFLDHVTTSYRRALLATKALSREFGDEVLFLWDTEYKRPAPMPSGMQEWILANTTLQLPGHYTSRAPDERTTWNYMTSRLSMCCDACTIS